MYRYWLYLEMLEHSAFWSGNDDEWDNDDNDDDDDEGREERKFREGLTAFTSGLSIKELLEVLSIATFCQETTWWAAGLPSALTGLRESEFDLLARASLISVWFTAANHTFVVGDPYSLARALEARQLTDNYSYRSWELVRDHLRAVLLSRKVKEDEMDEKPSTAIVKLVVGAEDTCTFQGLIRGHIFLISPRVAGSRCATIKGVQLIGQPSQCPNYLILRHILMFLC